MNFSEATRLAILSIKVTFYLRNLFLINSDFSLLKDGKSWHSGDGCAVFERNPGKTKNAARLVEQTILVVVLPETD